MEIRKAQAADVPWMATLMAARREVYERYQPVFWKRAEGAEDGHAGFLAMLVDNPDVITLVAERGFVIATLVRSPPVYDPGGLTCSIDDYAVTDDGDWATVGSALLEAATAAAAQRGAAQVVVVTAHQDGPKREALKQAGLSIASEWWTAPLDCKLEP